MLLSEKTISEVSPKLQRLMAAQCELSHSLNTAKLTKTFFFQERSCMNCFVFCSLLSFYFMFFNKIFQWHEPNVSRRKKKHSTIEKNTLLQHNLHFKVSCKMKGDPPLAWHRYTVEGKHVYWRSRNAVTYLNEAFPNLDPWYNIQRKVIYNNIIITFMLLPFQKVSVALKIIFEKMVISVDKIKLRFTDHRGAFDTTNPLFCLDSIQVGHVKTPDLTHLRCHLSHLFSTH